jgi:hypothetical protein
MIAAKLAYAKLITHITVFASAGGLLAVLSPHVLTPTGGLEGSPVVAKMVEYEVSVGDRFAAVGEVRAAIGAYETAASLSRAQRQVPTVAMRRIANVLYYDSQFRTALRTLEGLADEAARLGDVETEFWAVIDAAQMARLAHANRRAQQLTERATRLLESGQLDNRAALQAKMENTNLTVFAPHLESR